MHNRDLFIVEMFLASTETEHPLREIRGLMHNRLRQIVVFLCAEDGLKAATSIYFNINIHQRLLGKQEKRKKTQVSNFFLHRRQH